MITKNATVMDQHLAAVLIAILATQVLDPLSIILSTAIIISIGFFLREARAHSEAVRADLDKTRERLHDSERALETVMSRVDRFSTVMDTVERAGSAKTIRLIETPY